MKHKRILNKKGATLTLIAIFLSFLFIAMYELNNPINNITFNEISKRALGINSFITDLESDFDNVVYISGYRALLGMQQWVVKNGTYITNLNSTFKKLFENGTIYGKNSTIMMNSEFSTWLSIINNEANERNIHFYLHNLTVKIFQNKTTGPWYIGVFVGMNYSLIDYNNVASWNRSISYTSRIPIESFEDPLYIISTYGRSTNYIHKSPFDNHFVNGNNVTNLTIHLEKGYYIASSSAPDYLHRLTGNITACQEGIESMVYLSTLSSQGLIIDTDKSDIDYIYFSNSNPVSYHIDGMPSWFRLDNESNHLAKYQVQNLIS